MTAVTQALSAALIDFVWQGSIVGALLWITLLAMRGRSANIRYFVSCVGLAVMAATPVVTTAVLYARSTQADSAVQPVVNISNAIASGWIGVRSNGFTTLGRLEAWTLSLWSAGVLLFSIRLAWGWRRARLLGRG